MFTNKLTYILCTFFATISLLVAHSAVFAGDFQSNSTGNWNTAGTWTLVSGTDGDGIPDSDDNVNIIGGNPRTITIPAGYTAACTTLNINSTSADVQANLTFTDATSILNVSGNVAMNAPSTTGGNIQSITMNGGTLTIGGTLRLSSYFKSNGNKTFISQLLFTGGGTVSVAGNITLTSNSSSSPSKIDMTNGGTLKIGASITKTNSTFTPGTNGTVNYNGTGAQTIDLTNFTYPNLTINNTSPSGATLGATITSSNVAGNISVGNATSGSLFVTGNYAVTLGNSKTLTIASGSTMDAGTSVISFGTSATATINGIFKTSNTTGFFGATNTAISNTNSPTISLGSFSTIEYNGTTQTITNCTYYNLVVSGSGTKTAQGTTTVNKDFTISAGIFDAGPNIITINGNWVNSGVFSSIGTVVINGSSASQTLTGANAFNNLTLTNAIGNFILNSSITVNGILSLTGKLITGSNTVTFGITAANPLETSANRIEGNTVMAPRSIGVGSLTFLGINIAAGTDNIGNVSLTRVTGSDGIITVNGNSGIQCYWDITSDTPPVSVRNVTFTWLSDLDNGQGFSASNLAEVWKKKVSSSDWNSIGTAMDVSGSNPRSITANLSSFSRLSVSSTNRPLPVELLSFNASREDNKVKITWATATETNNDYFTIEKSADGFSFEPLTFVNGAGNSNSLLYYTETDNEPLSGISYYRLKQTDFDGKFTYSTIASVDFTTKENNETLGVYANAGTITLFLNHASSAPAKIQVFDITGKLIYVNDIELIGSSFTLNSDKLTSGIYIIIVSSENRCLSQKVMIP